MKKKRAYKQKKKQEENKYYLDLALAVLASLVIGGCIGLLMSFGMIGFSLFTIGILSRETIILGLLTGHIFSIFIFLIYINMLRPKREKDG